MKQEDLDKLLVELDEKIKLLTQLGKKCLLLPPGFYAFDIYVNGVLNRSVNLLKGFCSLMRDNNFIAAAPLIRLHLDSLLRLYAPHLTNANIDEFARTVMGGTPIRKIKDRQNQKLTDARLVEKLSEIPEFDWIKDVYETANGYVHYSDQLIFAAMKTEGEEGSVNFTIGQHDEFIPFSEKHGAAHWMNEITDGLASLVNSWVLQKESYAAE